MRIDITLINVVFCLFNVECTTAKRWICMASAHIVLSVMKCPADQRYIELPLTI